jgi:hypothetical protein
MKFLLLIESDPKDIDAIQKKLAKVRERHEKTGELRKGFKPLYPVHVMEAGKSFMICEADEEGIIQYNLDYAPLIKAKFIPIIPLDSWQAEYQKTQQ